MIDVQLKTGVLAPDEQQILTDGFAQHTEQCEAPHFRKERLNWLAYEGQNHLVGALTADLLWDWIYVDELWVSESRRGRGLGKRLMGKAEDFAALNALSGLWLWTQSWQAADFYQSLGYEEFTRFPDFPRDYFRIGFRKVISPGPHAGSQVAAGDVHR
ncbi:MAG: GNAT family N-acetyltransferase [Cyanobacteria bacterium K_Offshore_surface_m2_011]|nr:GNAT family N-acetyltransferase [Cyanobacteria bacterium K_Offshore_surface_m2_011]